MTAQSIADANANPLPGKAIPYRLPAGTGKGFLLFGQVNRFLATADETGGLMAIANGVGPAGTSPPAHYHDVQHDILYCVKGRIEVSAGDKTWRLADGDVVSIPPHTPHTFRLLSHYTELLSPIYPPKWPRFFEIMGVPYGAGAYPPVDDKSRPSREKAQQVAAEEIMVTVPSFVPAAPSFEDAGDAIPAERQLYFLRAGEGPRHLLFGQVCFQIVPGHQTDHRTAMTITEGPAAASTPKHVHQRTHEGIFCIAGGMRVWVDGKEHQLAAGDFVSIPAGAPHSYQLDTNFNRFATLVAPAGIERLHEIAGVVAEQRIFPEVPQQADTARLKAAEQQLDIKFLGGA